MAVDNYGGALHHLPHDALMAVRPDLYEPPRGGAVGGPEEAMQQLFTRADLRDVAIQRFEHTTYIADLNQWWSSIRNCGFSGFLSQMETAEIEALHDWLLREAEKTRHPDGRFHLLRPAILGMGRL